MVEEADLDLEGFKFKVSLSSFTLNIAVRFFQPFRLLFQNLPPKHHNLWPWTIVVPHHFIPKWGCIVLIYCNDGLKHRVESSQVKTRLDLILGKLSWHKILELFFFSHQMSQMFYLQNRGLVPFSFWSCYCPRFLILPCGMENCKCGAYQRQWERERVRLQWKFLSPHPSGAWIHSYLFDCNTAFAFRQIFFGGGSWSSRRFSFQQYQPFPPVPPD